MAENDYIGNIQTNRWNSLNQGYLSRTPSWMQGEFKQGPRVGTQRFRATSSGARLDWGQGDTSPRVHAFGAKPKTRSQRLNQSQDSDQPQQPSFLSNLITKRATSRAMGRSKTSEEQTSEEEIY
jgi:hypothetical protein